MRNPNWLDWVIARLELREVAAWSHAKKAVEICIVLTPAVLIAAFLLFPIAEKWNLGYPMFDLACIVALEFAFLGLGLVVLQKWQRQMRVPVWRTIVLVVEGALVLPVLFFNDFYWAFERGYFLD